jgi:hypothetical protein
MSIPWSMIGKAIGFLLSTLPASMAKDVIDRILDIPEKNCQGKPYQATVMATTNYIRAMINVPDDDVDQANPR